MVVTVSVCVQPLLPLLQSVPSMSRLFTGDHSMSAVSIFICHHCSSISL